MWFSTASIQRLEEETDLSGGVTKSYTTLASIPCNVQPVTAKVAEIYMQRNIRVDTLFLTPKAVTFLKGDVISFKGNRYYIEGLRNYCELGLVYEYATYKTEEDVV